MPSASKMANFSKGESERPSFFGKMKRKLTKSKRPGRDGTDGHIGSEHDVDQDRGSSMNGHTAYQNGASNGCKGQNDNINNYSSDDAGNDYEDIPEMLRSSNMSRYQQQGARPKCTVAGDNLGAPVSPLSEVRPPNGSAATTPIDLSDKSPEGEAEDQRSDSIDDLHTKRSLNLDEIEMVDVGDKEPLSDSKESLEPLIVQMSTDLPVPPCRKLSLSPEKSKRHYSDEESKADQKDYIPQNGQIVDICTDDRFQAVADGNEDANKNGSAAGQQTIENALERTIRLEDIASVEKRTKDKSDNLTGRNYTRSLYQKNSSAIGKTVRPKCPPRPLSLNLNLESPPPIPPRSPLTQTFSLAEPELRPPPDTSVLEDGTPSHVFLPTVSSQKGRSKTLPCSPRSLSPSSPVDKTKKSKTNRFSRFLKGKGSKDRHSIHVTMMANRTLPEIPNEPASPSSRHRTQRSISADASRGTLSNAGSVNESGPGTPRSGDDRKNEEGESDLSRFTSSLRQLAECGWYWGPMNWDDAEAKLANAPDGAFLVRDSSNDRYILSLSFRSQSTTHHTRIEHSQGKFGFWSQPQSHGSSSIVEFIEKAMQHSKNGKFLYFLRPRFPGAPPVPVQLTQPISRFKRVQTLQHKCRFLIRKLVRLDHIQYLPLPKRVKEYLFEGQYYTPEDVRPIEDEKDSDDEGENS
ncbi:suppressor of cytokine signaling 5-like [Ptychodera flava]|uniref:suppressor of cytokine signaling 5-like n=1 Tax=Ptychodera flava TaxID=63121 RepID=UPI00396A559D